LNIFVNIKWRYGKWLKLKLSDLIAWKSAWFLMKKEYLRFAVIDEVDKTEQQYLTALDINNKAKLTKIRDYINNILTPNHNKKV
jgi:hypothetical protein